MRTPANRPMTPGEWAALLVLASVWGGSFLFNAVAVRDLPVADRRRRAGRARGARPRRAARPLRAAIRTAPACAGAFLAMGLLNNVLPFSLIVWAQTTVPSGVASIINAATPLFGVLLAHFLTDRRADDREPPRRHPRRLRRGRGDDGRRGPRRRAASPRRARLPRRRPLLRLRRHLRAALPGDG